MEEKEEKSGNVFLVSFCHLRDQNIPFCLVLFWSPSWLSPFMQALCCAFSSCHYSRDGIGTNFYWVIPVPRLCNSVPFLCSSSPWVAAASYCPVSRLSLFPLWFLRSFITCVTTSRYSLDLQSCLLLKMVSLLLRKL